VYNKSTFNNEEFGVINPMPRRGKHDDPQFYQMGEEGNPPDAYELHVTRKMKRLVFRDFTISTKYPNNIVLVKDMGVCVVHDMRYDEPSDSFKVLLSPFVQQDDFFTGRPCNSSDFSIFKVTGGTDKTKRKSVDANEIVNQFVALVFDNTPLTDVERKQLQNQQPSAKATASLDKAKVVWVCIPLMHALFQ
jgi:hypothetical protein